MIIYPAMDLIGGRIVRLEQGRFDEVTSYSTRPADALDQFASAGAKWAHIVDLDGARAGRPIQHELIADLAGSTALRLQVAGGVRERNQLSRMFDAGVARVVIGSLAVKQPQAVRSWIDEFGPDRIALSLDIRIIGSTPIVAIAGWTKNSGESLWDIAAMYPDACHLLVTDIERDGMLEGPNFSLYDEIARRLPGFEIQASGGVSSLLDFQRLRTAGAIVGRAMWEGKIRLEEALGLARA
jgi:phosphoribosylformimino-5-aminoimidazole carboxamide ribotide isomerase